MHASSSFNLDENPLLLRHRALTTNYSQTANTTTDVPAAHVPEEKRGPLNPKEKKGSCDRLSFFLPPFLSQIIPQYKKGIQQYNRSKLFNDVLAGVTVAVMAIPLAMSYAKLAGLPPYFGLYAALTPSIVFPLVATSRQLAVGPAALVCLLLSNGLSVIVPFDEEGDDTASQEQYIRLAIQSSVLVGVLYIGMSFCQLGFVTQFLSRPLISGFNSGAAVIIVVSQLKYVLGMTYTVQSSRMHKLVQALIEHADQFNWRTLVLGLAGIGVVLGCKMVAYKYPEKYSWMQAVGPFTVAAVSIALTAGLDLPIPTIKEIPPGLPQITVEWWTPMSMDLWLMVVSIVVVGYVQAFAISKSFAYKHGYELDSSQELVALGMANFVGAIFQSFPVTGCLGQSAVNDSVGAVSGVASCVTGVCVMMVLLFLTPVFEYLPLAALGATVIAYVSSMLDYPEAIYLYHTDKFDFTVWLVAFLGTMFLGVEYGLAIAVGLSLLLVVYEAAYPHTSVLGRLPGTSLYRNVKQFPEVERNDGIVVVRINSPMFFANALSLRDKIRKYKQIAQDDLDRRRIGMSVQYIILDVSPVTHIDTTAMHVLQDMIQTQMALGTQLCFAMPNIHIKSKLSKGKVAETVGQDHFFASHLEAVRWCLTAMEQHNVAVDQELPESSSEMAQFEEGAIEVEIEKGAESESIVEA